jgi:hypothetical protein
MSVFLAPLLQAMLRRLAADGLAAQGALPLRALRALWLSLSDLSLRCWPCHPGADFDADARAADFAALAAPLVQLLQAAGAAAGGGAQLSDAAAAATRRAAAAAAAVVQSYSGSPQTVRGIVCAALVAPVLPGVAAALRALCSSGGGGGGGGGGSSGGGAASAALLRLVSAALDVLATELGTEAVEQLLGALVQAFSAGGALPCRSPRRLRPPTGWGCARPACCVACSGARPARQV